MPFWGSDFSGLYLHRYWIVFRSVKCFGKFSTSSFRFWARILHCYNKKWIKSRCPKMQQTLSNHWKSVLSFAIRLLIISIVPDNQLIMIHYDTDSSFLQENGGGGNKKYFFKLFACRENCWMDENISINFASLLVNQNTIWRFPSSDHVLFEFRSCVRTGVRC